MYQPARSANPGAETERAATSGRAPTRRPSGVDAHLADRLPAPDRKIKRLGHDDLLDQRPPDPNGPDERTPGDEVDGAAVETSGGPGVRTAAGDQGRAPVLRQAPGQQ